MLALPHFHSLRYFLFMLNKYNLPMVGWNHLHFWVCMAVMKTTEPQPSICLHSCRGLEFRSWTSLPVTLVLGNLMSSSGLCGLFVTMDMSHIYSHIHTSTYIDVHTCITWTHTLKSIESHLGGPYSRYCIDAFSKHKPGLVSSLLSEKSYEHYLFL